MTKLAQNTFEKGLRIDNDASLQEDGTYVAGHNIDIAEIGAKLAALNVRGSNLAVNVTDTESTDDAIQVLGAYRTSADIDRGDGFVQREGIILFVKGATPPPPAEALQPIVSPDAGIYSGFVAVTVTNQRAGETIYYTTDGSIPTESSTIYGGIVVVSTSTTLRFRAFSPIVGVAPSEVTTVAYVISALTVTISPAAGTYLSSRLVTLGSSSEDAVIYYTLDGSTPDDTSTQYTSPFTLTENATVKAIAIITGIATSAIAESTFGIQLIAPELTASGTAINTFEWTASNPNGVGDIRYTTNGSTPNGSSPIYTTPITVSATTNVKAAVFNATNVTSDVTDRTYTVQCDEPVITPAGGAIASDDTITLTTTTSGASIYYTTDGSTPTGSSTLYSAPFFLTASSTVKAIAIKSGLANSTVASEVFSFFAVSWYIGNIISGSGNGNLYSSINDGTTWTLRQPAGATTLNWSLASLSTLSAHIFALGSGRIFRSIDVGTTWNEITSPNSNTPFQSLTCSADAGYMLAVSNRVDLAQPNIYLTDVNGANIAALTVDGITTARAWISPLIGVDNQRIALGSDNRVAEVGAAAVAPRFTSNGGTTWTTPTPLSTATRLWVLVGDRTLNKIIAFEFNALSTFVQAHRTLNFGSTWDIATGITASGFFSYSGDGSRLYRMVGSTFSVSTNDGTSFTTLTITGYTGTCQGVQANETGEKIIVITSLRAFISLDFGATWAQTQPVGNVNRNWDLIGNR